MSIWGIAAVCLGAALLGMLGAAVFRAAKMPKKVFQVLLSAKLKAAPFRAASRALSTSPKPR